MKNWVALASVICLLLVLTLSVSAYTPWGTEVFNDDLPTVVIELRTVYELASATQAASPDFLSDLGSLITRLEALVFAPTTSTFGFETLMSTPVEVSFFNRYVGSDEQIGQILYFRVIGATNGRIWGSDIYTRDTDIRVAAVHAGLLHAGETGIILVEFLPGQASYEGTDKFGVSSRNFGSYDYSYRLRRIQ